MMRSEDIAECTLSASTCHPRPHRGDDRPSRLTRRTARYERHAHHGSQASDRTRMLNEAVARYHKLLEEYPNHELARFSLGKAYYDLGDYVAPANSSPSRWAQAGLDGRAYPARQMRNWPWAHVTARGRIRARLGTGHRPASRRPQAN